MTTTFKDALLLAVMDTAFMDRLNTIRTEFPAITYIKAEDPFFKIEYSLGKQGSMIIVIDTRSADMMFFPSSPFVVGSVPFALIQAIDLKVKAYGQHIDIMRLAAKLEQPQDEREPDEKTGED